MEHIRMPKVNAQHHTMIQWFITTNLFYAIYLRTQCIASTCLIVILWHFIHQWAQHSHCVQYRMKTTILGLHLVYHLVYIFRKCLKSRNVWLLFRCDSCLQMILAYSSISSGLKDCSICSTSHINVSYYFVYILQVENVRLVDRSSSRRTQVGTLYLTATHTIFVAKGSEDRNELWVSACLIIFGISFKHLNYFANIQVLNTDMVCLFFTGPAQFSM